MRTLRLLLFFPLVVGAGAQAQHAHLVPEVGPLAERDEYEALLGEVFNPDRYDNAILARMVHLPSFGREWLVGVRRSGDGYEAFSVVPDSSLWYTGWVEQDDGSSAWTPEAARRVGIARASEPLNGATAERIGAVWERAILATRYPARDDLVVVDGVGAHFSRWVRGRGMIAGETHSPPAGSVADALMELGLMIGRYAVGEGVTEPALREAAARVAALIEAPE